MIYPQCVTNQQRLASVKKDAEVYSQVKTESSLKMINRSTFSQILP